MKAKEFLNIGFKQGPIIGALLSADNAAKTAGLASDQRKLVANRLVRNPSDFFEDPYFGQAAKLWNQILHPEILYTFSSDKPMRIWGRDQIDEQTIDQMKNALSIPPAVCGAMMPDSHLGYGLNIGGVLALDNAVMPYGVGVDIACRMMLTVTSVKIEGDTITNYEHALTQAIAKHTRFGLGVEFKDKKDHPVMDMDWSIIKHIFDKDVAWRQLGTSGGGNHFVDIGEIEFANEFMSVPPGKYLAILTHSGSRGVGAKIANYYTRLAESKHPLLPPQYKRLSWLSLNDEDGLRYWAAMELAGAFASACHHVIHSSLLKELGFDTILQVENHHNYAWKENINGRELIVHRKGATPAAAGVLGIIPGSMATPGFLVSGKGNAESLNSASHGAGRQLSRTQAKQKYRWGSVNDQLRHCGVKLISGGLDEVPGAYKPIEEVMKAQEELVEIIARFNPKLVKMSADGESED